MRAHKLQATLPEDHRLSVEAQLPDDFPPGPVEVIVLAGGPERRDIPQEGPRSRALPRGTRGTELLSFVGVLDEAEARRMEEAIEEECERVDPRDW